MRQRSLEKKEKGGGDTSVAERDQGQERGSDEKDVEQKMTRVGGKGAQQRCRSTRMAVAYFGDIGVGDDLMMLGRRWCEHLEECSKASPKMKTIRPEEQYRRRILTKKSFDGGSVLRRIAVQRN